MDNAVIHWHGLARFSKKTGKIDKTIVGRGRGILQMWALQNTPKTKVCMVLDLEDRVPVLEVVGSEDGFPSCCREVDEMNYNIPDELYDLMLEETKED